MTAALLLCSAIMGQARRARHPRRSADLTAYEDGQGRGRPHGRRPDQAGPLVRGPRPGRRAAQAPDSRTVLLDPANPTARGLLGQVSYNGKWVRPDRVRAAIEDDPEVQAGDAGVQPPPRRDRRHRRRPAAAGAVVRQDTASRTRRRPTTRPSCGSTRAATASGRSSATRSTTAAGPGPRTSRPRRPRPRPRSTPTSTWKPLLEKYRDGLSSRDDAKRRTGRGRPGRDRRPSGRAHGLGRLRPRRRPAPEAGRAGAGADRRAVGLAGPGASWRSTATSPRSAAAPPSSSAAATRTTTSTRLIGLIHKPFKYKVVPVRRRRLGRGGFRRGRTIQRPSDYRVDCRSTGPPSRRRLFRTMCPLRRRTRPGGRMRRWLGTASLDRSGLPPTSRTRPSDPRREQPIQSTPTRLASWSTTRLRAAVQRDQTDRSATR